MSNLYIGAIGEKLIELGLLWNGWAPANLNQSVKNAPNVDLLAAKGNKTVSLQIKTSGPNSQSMLQLGYKSEKGVFNTKDGPKAEFIIFVRLFDKEQYEIYVVPFEEAERVATQTYLDWKKTPKKDGSKRKRSPAVIRFTPNRNRPDVSNYQEKWSHYKDAWHLLDKSASHLDD